MAVFISIYIVGFSLVFLICALLTRWIFRIDQNLEYQRLQYEILLKIACKLGVDEQPPQESSTDQKYMDDDAV
ncbi:hypothetical protein [Mucilaginibacter aquariorum]|uniref:Uncharacterized protein n=1 Tax=Mucilaginibacter aquariorum TaxID=2967225 RepID=A0ABT1T678_9SPHI|nr:hypothetical protein [Mucilaginibacter aquariorum]MCQ6960087.1 hypothetical protein [Mucilaginibacter aquariorum]